jgi:hypothetical protein
MYRITKRSRVLRLSRIGHGGYLVFGGRNRLSFSVSMWRKEASRDSVPPITRRGRSESGSAQRDGLNFLNRAKARTARTTFFFSSNLLNDTNVGLCLPTVVSRYSSPAEMEVGLTSILR